MNKYLAPILISMLAIGVIFQGIALTRLKNKVAGLEQNIAQVEGAAFSMAVEQMHSIERINHDMTHAYLGIGYAITQDRLHYYEPIPWGTVVDPQQVEFIRQQAAAAEQALVEFENTP